MASEIYLPVKTISHKFHWGQKTMANLNESWKQHFTGLAIWQGIQVKSFFVACLTWFFVGQIQPQLNIFQSQQKGHLNKMTDYFIVFYT